MKYKPLYDNILVKLDKSEDKTESGIYLPNSGNERQDKGEVVAVGPGKMLDNGELKPLQVKVGDKVIFKSYAPSEIPGEKEMVIISESDVLAIIQD